VREKAELIQDTDGTALALDGVIQDITEQEARKTALQAAKDRAEAASEQNRRLAARLQKAQRIARIGSWSWDLATNELWWSEEIYRIFGLDPDQFAATYDAFLARVHPEDRDAVARNVENALSGNQPYTIDHRIVRPDGVERTVREEAEILFDEHGQATVMDGVVQDITEDQERETELRAAKERAEEAAVAKSRFLAMMSHELRTPLNAIIGFGDLIAREAFGPLGSERYREYAADIHASGQHLLDVINDVLEMSRMETGGAELAEETVALGEVVNNAVRLVGEKANRHGISITTDVDPRDLAIVGDLPRVRQILFNLIDNAIKFSDRNSQIRVRADRTDEGCARLHVTDQGGGIPEHIKPRITDAFTQASETLSRNRDGIGLGLSLVKAFAELHGGSLEIDSEVGRGTTMTVVFPVERTLADGGSRSAAE
jgi:two-component system cell cycle sensor histidine kinase PleC